MTDVETISAPSAPAIISGNGRDLNDLDNADLRSLIEDRGAVLLRGFENDIERFAALGARLCATASYNESPNREMLQADGAVQTVNLGADPFPLHPELSREPWRPDLAMFSCIDPPEVGGQTNICDGIEIAKNLSSELLERLEDAQLFYIRPASEALLQFWLNTSNPSDDLLENPPAQCPYWFRRAKGRIMRGFTRPALEPTLFQNEPAWVNFALFARDYLRLQNIPLLDGKIIDDLMLDEIRSVARRQTYSHRWEQGDVLLLDNSRFMHGRKAIANPQSRKIATYFGYLHGVTRDGVEPPDPIWRRQSFIPPEGPNEA